MAEQPDLPLAAPVKRRYRLEPQQIKTHRRRSLILMVTALLLWFGLGFGVPIYGATLNQYQFLGFPLGYFLTAKMSLIGFSVLLFWFADRQNSIDEECGVAED